MTAEEAETYHAEQVNVLAGTDADIIGGYTVAYAAEASGMVQAIKQSKRWMARPTVMRAIS